MKNEWIEKNYNILKEHCRNKYDREDFEDIFQETFLTILEKDEEIINNLILKKEIVSYFNRLFWINCHSKLGPYQWKYNKHKYLNINYCELPQDLEIEEEEIIDDVNLEEIVSDLNVHFVDKIIYVDYIKRKKNNNSFSFREMAEEGDYDLQLLFLRYKKVKNAIYLRLKYGV